MPGPDFPLSRRQLRRARIQDALGLEREGVNVPLHRNRLLERLAAAADEHVSEFDSRPESVTDTVVSLALTELDEAAPDALVVVLLCVAVLADDGQFARLALLADRLRTVGGRLEVERPFLWTATNALASLLQGAERDASRALEERLGLATGPNGPGTAQRRPRSREQLNDLLAATALRASLTEHDTSFAERAREAALAVSDGLLLAFVDAVIAWQGAVAQARPGVVLASADPIFATDSMQQYIARRRIPTLFPPQMRAIDSGATLDGDRMIALPTSSGKTLLAEFRIAAALQRNPGTRAIYVAPYRLLARQVEASLRQGIGAVLGYRIRDLGSGYDTSTDFGPDDSDLEDVVICTPERLDALLRLASSGREGSRSAQLLFDTCSLLIFDELHLIGRPNRGPRFELVLARVRARYPEMHFLGLSAATQGADDLAEWLTGQEPILGARRPTGTLEILWDTDGTLRQRVAGAAPTTVATLPRKKKQALDDAAALILRLDVKYRPVLAVMPTRPNAESLAGKIMAAAPAAGSAWRDTLTRSQLATLATAVEEVRALLGADHPLATSMEYGVAFHHAGVPTHVLQQIERLAAARVLRVVCATTTVAEGADLPFRVVVIPNLNFPGTSRRLERDLYLNIVGRAGRANVSVEGLVFILGSEAVTLRDHVRASLWSSTMQDRVRGRLGEVGTRLSDAAQWSAYLDVQSQVMGWLGDGESYVDDQAKALAQQTFTYAAGSASKRSSVVELIGDTLQDLEDRGLAVAGSPWRLTERGRTARLTGLSAPSVLRLEQAIDRGREGWLLDLVGVEELTENLAGQVAMLLLESVEVFETGLWLRKHGGSSEAAKFETLWAFGTGDLTDYRGSEEFEADIDLLTHWLLGASYASLAARAPTYDRANALFGGADVPKRTSDATEYIGKLNYPATWVWSGVKVLAGGLGEAIPPFLRSAIAAGVPSAAAAWLVDQGSLTRPAALRITEVTGPSRDAVIDWLDVDDPDDAALGLTRLDEARLSALRARIQTRRLI